MEMDTNMTHYEIYFILVDDKESKNMEKRVNWMNTDPRMTPKILHCEMEESFLL